VLPGHRSGRELLQVKQRGLSAEIELVPVIVTQIARSALPSVPVSNIAQASPVFAPDQSVLSHVQPIDVDVPPQLPNKQYSLRSFWPGSSSFPCASGVHCACDGTADNVSHNAAAATAAIARRQPPRVRSVLLNLGLDVFILVTSLQM